MKKILRNVMKYKKLPLAILMFILVIEICARVDDWVKYGAPFFGEYSSDILRTRDENNLIVNNPNVRFEKWKNNNLGFRGPDISINKLPNMKRIICLGTSETYGLYESPEKEWPAQLSEKLGIVKEIEIINASVAGMGLDNFEKYADNYLLKISPDVIILMVNPFSHAMKMKRSLTKDTKLITNQKNSKSVAKQSFRLYDVFLSSRSLPKIKQVVKQAIPNSLLKVYQLWDTKKQVRRAEQLQLHEDKELIDRIPLEYEESYRHDLMNLLSYFSKKNIDVILTTYPSLFSQDNIVKHYEIMLDFRKICPEFSLIGLIDISTKLNRVIRETAKDLSINLIDLDAFLPKNLSYFADNVHYTDLGAETIATQIAAYLAKNAY